MADLIYQTGTVSVVAGGTTVAGTDTIWTNLRRYDWISIDNEPLVPIEAVSGVDQLTIAPWQYGTKTNVTYKAYQISPARFSGGEFALDVTKLVAALNKDGFYHFVGPDETVPDPSLGDEGQYARQPTTGKEWVKTGGEWVYLGITLGLPTPVVWSPATTYGLRALVKRVGKLWASIQAVNLNHPPETSPTSWEVFLDNGDAYDVALYDTDRPDESEEFLVFQFTRTVTFNAGLAESRAYAKVAATGASVFTLYKQVGEGAPTSFGTISFAPGSKNGAFASAADVTFNIGDILLIIAPTPRDATLSRVSGTIAGYRS